jgi:hypothetical protein
MLFSRYYLCALFFIAVTVSYTYALEAEETKSLDNFDLHVRQLEEETEPFDDFHHGSPPRQDIVKPNNSYLRALREHQSDAKKKKPTVVETKKKKKKKTKNVVKPLVHNAKTENPRDHEFGRQSSTRTSSSQSKNHYVVKSSSGGGNAVKKSGGKSGKYAKIASKPKPKASKTNHASRSAGEEGWHAVMSMMDYF